MFRGILSWWRTLRGGGRSGERRYRYSVERERAAIGRCIDALEGDLNAAEVPDETLRALQVTLDELLGNVLMHGGQDSEPITVEVALGAQRMETRLTYRASDFDPTLQSAPDATTTIDETPIGGLGIHLVRTLMDDFRHEYVDGRNRLTLSKRW